MQLDAKQQVLCACYAEYQKDLPDMDQINCTELDMPEDVFVISVKKLMDEGLIDDVHLVWEADSNIPVRAVLSLTRLSEKGIDYVEQFFDIDPFLPGQAKVKIINEALKKSELKELYLYTENTLDYMDKT